MSEIIAGIFIILSTGATLIALLTTLIYLIPARVNHVQHILETSTRRAFGIGLINTIFFGLLVAFLTQGGEFLALIALLITLTLLAFALIGLTSFLQIVRERIYHNTSRSLLSATIRAAVLLIAAGLTPIAGWFILTPLVLITGLGATLITLIRRQDPSKSSLNDMPY